MGSPIDRTVSIIFWVVLVVSVLSVALTFALAIAGISYLNRH